MIRRLPARAAALAACLTATLLASCGGPPPAREPAAGTSPSGIEIIAHPVQSGDTLARIADLYYGDPARAADIATANDLCDRIDSPVVGVAVDVYHLWFDPELEAGIVRAGQSGSSAVGGAGRLFAFHVCDWRSPTRDLLNDRGLMGEGCIDIPRIRGWVEAAGFDGFIEVEIFSTEFWALDQRTYLKRIVDAYEAHV